MTNNRVNRRDFLRQTGRVLVGACGALQLARPSWLSAADLRSGKPNIVLILADDLGWSDLGCYGSPFCETPHIDKLAREGMRFTDAYSAAPICSPTRASILTGRSPARLHLTHITQFINPTDQKLLGPKTRTELPLEEATIAEALKQAGYVTASIGKWHLGDTGFEPQDHGFDVNIAGGELGSAPDYFHPYRREYPNNRVFQLSHLPGGQAGEYLTDRLTDDALRFIDQNKGKPFFLCLSHYAPHTALGARLQAKEEKIAKYQARATPADPPHKAIYAAMIESLDESVGRILQRLDELKLTERTLVIFVSDNGGFHESTSNAPLRGAKGSLYEGGIRVPLIVRWPGVVRPGSGSSTPVTSDDFFPTLLEIAGEHAKPARDIDGVSLVPVLKRNGDLPREALCWHYPHYTGDTTPCSAIRQGDYKLIEFYEDGRLQLYNLKDDLGEKTNLAEQLPAKARELQAKLAGWLKSVGAQMPRTTVSPQTGGD